MIVNEQGLKNQAIARVNYLIKRGYLDPLRGQIAKKAIFERLVKQQQQKLDKESKRG